MNLQRLAIKARIFGACAAALSGLLCQNSYAATQVASGHVYAISTDDTQPTVSAGVLALQGVSSLSTCGVLFGFVQFAFRDDLHGQQMYAMVLAAALAGV
jgi:hypothetical protein